MLFWPVDGVISSIVEIWVLGQWTKNNEEIVFLTSSLMDAMTQNIDRHKNGYFQPILDIQNEPIRPIYWSSTIKGSGNH